MIAQNYSKAVSDIKFLANRFSGVLAVIDKIDELAAVENLIEERKKTHEQLVKQHEQAITIHAHDLSAMVEKHNAQRDSILASARAEADKMLKSAQLLVAQVHDFAVAERKRAESDAKAIKSAAETANKNLVSIQSEVRQERVVADGLRQEQSSLAQQIQMLKDERRQLLESLKQLS